MADINNNNSGVCRGRYWREQSNAIPLFETLLLAVLSTLLPPPSMAQIADDMELLMVPAFVASHSRNRVVKPGPNNTGVRHGALLVSQSGSITVVEQNAIIENLNLTGCINVEADNVIVRNVRINCSGFYGIRIDSESKGLVIEDVEIFGMQSSGILGSNFTVRRANIHDSGADAIKPGRNVLIENSWMHRLGTKPLSHSDAVQMVAGGDVTIRENNIDMPHALSGYTNSQCMIIQTNNGPIDNILIQGNWLNGGGYCVQVNDKGNGHGPPTNVRILDNKFGRDCNFGILRFAGSSPELSGNVYEDSGESIGTDFTLCSNDFD